MIKVRSALSAAFVIALAAQASMTCTSSDHYCIAAVWSPCAGEGVDPLDSAPESPCDCEDRARYNCDKTTKQWKPVGACAEGSLCKGMQCGEDDGVPCGTCNPRQICDPSQKCKDVCVDMECGEDQGVICGECSLVAVCEDNVCKLP